MVVKLGLRSILLLVAVILFVVAIFAASRNQADWIAAGLAFFAGAFLLGEMGGRLRRRL